jgi:Caspase domain
MRSKINHINGDCAVIIGVNKYTNYYGGFESLKFALNDAYEIRNFLEKHMSIKNIYYFTDDCPETTEVCENELVYLEKSRPTYINLSCFFSERFKDKCMDGSSKLWFFFSGHGQWIKSKQYLMASDSKFGDAKYAIDLNLVSGIFRDSGAGNIVMFIDACRTKIKENNKGVRNIQPVKEEGIITFYSCSHGEQSYEHPNINHSIFTEALLKGLKTNDNNCSTVEKLDVYIKNYVHKLL